MPPGLLTLRPAEVARLGALGQREGSAGGGGRMLLVTGGAGFIGSNLVAGLNEAGRIDIVVNDALGNADKWRNLGKRQLADVVPPGELIGWLDRRKLEAVIHLGAISDTTATDADAVLATNFRLSLRLLDWCTATRTPFIYASSAATYGDGSDMVAATSATGHKSAAEPACTKWQPTRHDCTSGAARPVGRREALPAAGR